MQFDSLDFQSEHARRYSQLSHEFTHSVYTGSSHPALTGDMDLLNRVVGLARENGGLNAGCGAGARDVHLLQSWGGTPGVKVSVTFLNEATGPITRNRTSNPPPRRGVGDFRHIGHVPAQFGPKAA